MANEIEPLEFIVDGSVFSRFADLTHDHNPIHRFTAYAHPMFRNTPAQGVYLISLFEMLARRNGFDFASYAVKFSNPAYPKDKLVFGGNACNSQAFLEARNQNSDLVASCTLDLSEKPSYQPSEEPVHSFHYYLSPENPTSFHTLLGSNEGWFPSSLVSALIPASLLQAGSNGNRRPIGIYRSIDVSSFAAPGPGLYRVDLFSKGEPKQIGGVLVYDHRGVCYRDNKPAPVLSGDIKVISSKELAI